MTNSRLDLVALGPPGLEPELASELTSLGFEDVVPEAGGVAFCGTWQDVWRANLWVRGASRILVRVGAFTALHLAQLDKRSRKLPWAEWLAPGATVNVEAVCRKSKIYHSGAAVQRVAGSIQSAVAGAGVAADGVSVVVRIVNNKCTISIDTSGELLHKRGFKSAVSKAPLRETLASLLLRKCGYDPSAPLVDPMCGSGTVLIEAAERAHGVAPGRERHFAFETFPSFDADAWREMKARATLGTGVLPIFGSDKSEDAIASARRNADRAGVGGHVSLRVATIQELSVPDARAGLVFINPPYGERIGNAANLKGLYRDLGRTLRDRFGGWRVGMITTDPTLAAAVGLKWADVSAPIPHGGLKVRLYQSLVGG